MTKENGMRKSMFMVLTLILVAAVTGAQEKRIFQRDGVAYAPRAARFVLTADDMDSELHEIRYSLDGEEARVYEGPIRIEEEGRHVITYRAVDALGNVSRENVYTVVIDDTPPRLVGTARGAGFVEDNTVYIRSDTAIVLTGDDNLSGLQSIHVSLDGTNFTTYQDVVFIPEEGEHTGYAYAVDNVGNRSRTYMVTGWVDNTPPVVRIVPQRPLTTANGNRYSVRGNQFSLRATDRISGVGSIYFSLNGSEFATYAAPLSITEPGDHVIRAKGVDLLGNESDPVELTFTVESGTPEPQLRAIIEE